MDISNYITEDHKEQINTLQDKLKKVIQPQKYKNTDKVYFIKHYKNGSKKIVCRTYRSAKKYTNQLFSNCNLAQEYYKLIYNDMFEILVDIEEDIYPKIFEDTILTKFCDIKDITLGDKVIYQLPNY